MATPETVEIATLLAPISAELPAGPWLRDDPVYDELKNAARGGGRSQFEAAEAEPPDWRGLMRLASTTLATRSKDLQIAAWLTEALTRMNGFPGLRDGFRVLRELQQTFWDTLHPQIEDGDTEFRAGLLSYLNESSAVSARESLGTAIEAIPLTIRLSEGGPYGYADRRDSREVENLKLQDPAKHQAAVDAGRLPGEQWDRAVAAGNRAFYEPLYADANEALEECDRLQATIVERFGSNAPSLLNVRKSIEDSRDLLWRILGEKRRLEPDLEELAAGEPAEGPSAAGQASGPLPLEPRDRADAVRRLAAVASFFKRTEPHSPVAYLVQKAMRWAEMPLEAWLQEVLADENAMARVREMLGIKGES